MPESRRRDRAGGRGRAPERTAPDACPGAWRRHDAADGALARFRLVGGALTAAELTVLAGASVEGGAPLELTSRGSVQVRGLAPSTADDLADALRGIGAGAPAVLDDRGRDLPCSVVASPRAGVVDDVAGTVAAALRGRTDLPGRLLVALDDGSGDVAGLGADVTVGAPPAADGVESRTPGVRGATPLSSAPDGAESRTPGVRGATPLSSLTLDGTDTGLRHPDPAALALAAVDAFAAVRDGRWRLAEVPDGPARVADAVRTRLDVTDATPRPTPAPPTRPRPGVGDDGVLEVLPPLGELDLTATSALVAALGPGVLRVTPWRTLVLRGLADPAATARALDDVGLETDAATPWAGLSACVGAPRCATSHTDVRADLAAAVRDRRAGHGQVPAHWVGCARACGTPGGRVAVVEATPGGGYRAVVRAGRVAR